jgi:hypothetical protein
VVSGRSGVFRSEEQLVRLLTELRREAAADGDTDPGETIQGSAAV